MFIVYSEYKFKSSAVKIKIEMIIVWAILLYLNHGTIFTFGFKLSGVSFGSKSKGELSPSWEENNINKYIQL